MKLESMEIEQHPLEPFLPGNARLLMLGSFPPQKKRWSMEFYYKTKKAFCKERLISFLQEKGIALFDTASAIRRLQDNASDKFLEVVQPTDVPALLHRIPQCKAIVTTGEKATDTLCTQFSIDKPKVGDFTEFLFENHPMRLYRMPSSSRAYPLALEKKAAAYRIMYQDLQML